MKINPKFLMMMAALSAGAALAAPAPTATSAGTTAGTVITNTASATYDDPTTGSAIATPISSNAVNTTVTALPGFDVAYSSGDADDVTAANAPSGYKEANALPGRTVTTKYTVVNNSNIDGYVVNLAAVTTGGLPTAAPANGAGGVQYFADDGAGNPTGPALTSVTLTNGGVKKIVQVITIPAAATSGAVYSATPQGSSAAVTTGTFPYAAYAEGTNQNTAAANTNGDLQPTQATVTTATLTVISPPSVPGSSTTPGTPTTGTTPPPGTPTGNTYVPPTTPTYTTTPTTPVTNNNPGTVVVIDGKNQDAYPKADNNAAADVVTFATNVSNSGSVPDTIIVQPDITGLPTGATIKLLDKNGNAIPETSVGSGKYVIPYNPSAIPANTPAADILTPNGQSAQYQVVVTYPDSDTNSATNPVPNQTNIVVPIDVFSGNVPQDPKKDSYTLTVHPPEMSLGDTTGTTVGDTVPNATLDKPVGVTLVTVDPTKAIGTSATDQTDRSAVFPMTVKNNGQYPDVFTLSGTVTIKNTSGPDTVVAVKYYKTDGTTLITQTDQIPVGKSFEVLAVVDVPTTALATTGAAGTNPAPKVTQTATGVYSTDSAVDDNDIINIIATGKVGLAKFVAKASVTAGDATTNTANNVTNNGVVIFNPADYTKADTEAAPKTNISYRIIGKNTYNSPVSKFYISDDVRPNTTFVSVALNPVIAKTIYRITIGASVGSWSATAPTASTAPVGAIIDIAADTDSDNVPDALPSNGEQSADFVLKVN